MNSTPQECASEVLDVIPLIMQAIRAEMRNNRSPELSVPQFRALAFVGRKEGATLSDLSKHIGLMPSATSTIVNGLVSLELVQRETSMSDRRKISLVLTKAGVRKLEKTRKQALECLTRAFERLSGPDCTRISGAMKTLRTLF